MTGATIQFDDPRDQLFLLYSEPYKGSIRSADIGYRESGFGFAFLGLLGVSTRRIRLYPETMAGWHTPTGDVAMTDLEREQTLRKIEILLYHQKNYLKVVRDRL